MAARSVSVPLACVRQVHEHLAKVGRAGYEGLGLWVGTVDGEDANVRQALIPNQRLIRGPNGVGVQLDGDELHRINVWLFKNGMTIIAQIHSHPTDAYHSGTDDDYAISTAVGSLSLVIPDFASRPFDLSQCAVYRLDAAARWCQLGADEAERLIKFAG